MVGAVFTRKRLMSSVGRFAALGGARGAQLKRIRSIFDEGWYLRQYPEVVAVGLEPLRHFMTRGWREGRDPSPLFSTTWYFETVPGSVGTNPLLHFLDSRAGAIHDPHPLFDAEGYLARYPDVASAGQNPLVHYLAYGAQEGRVPHPLLDLGSDRAVDKTTVGRNLISYLSGEGANPHPLFNDVWYRSSYPEITAGMSPLVDYVLEGHRLGRRPNPLCDMAWYSDRNAAAIPAGMLPLAHYYFQGWREGRDPHPLFSVSDYLANNADVAADGFEPLSHFLRSGWRENRGSHPLFDANWYLKTYPKVAISGQNPLVHYLDTGFRRGHDPNPYFNGAWYRDQHEGRLDGENPLVHYVTRGGPEERNPSRDFDRDYYLAHNPEVYESGRDPFIHFVQIGAAQGRHARASDRRTAECAVLDIPYEIRRAPPPLVGRDVCLFVTYTRDGEIDAHVLHQLEAYRRHGIATVVVLATDGLDRTLPAALDTCDGLIVRMNHGWDFAAWAATLAAIPDLWRARSLILANDSVYGPISERAFARVLERIRTSEKDMVALTDSYQVRRHAMSYFVVLTATGLSKKAVQTFWNQVRSIRDKQEVINRYELTPLEHWRREDVTVEILFPTSDDMPLAVNPTLVRWRDLVERGSPFLKVQLLRDDLPQADPTGWRSVVEPASGLVALVEGHLQRVWHSDVRPSCRPIPAPRRRFDRKSGLATYYGATPSIRPTSATDLAVAVPFRFGVPDHRLPERVAVIAHLFYPELGADLLARFAHIPVRADLFLTTDTEAKKRDIEATFARHTGGSVEVRVVPNVGRDIAPMLVACRDVLLSYDVFLHVHGKKSPHDERFARWRDYLLDNLLGSAAIVRSILALLAAERVGIVFSQHFPAVRALLNWGYDYDLAKDLLGRAGIRLGKDLVLDFPSSSFFWGRTAALKPLLDLELDWADFPAEAGQVDGTIAHAIERCILFFAEASGHRWAKVAAEASCEPSTTVPVFEEADLSPALLRVHRSLLGNRLAPLRDRERLPELTPIATRPDHNPRPRLNLVLPTIHPIHVFGGITTAIKIFEEIGRACGEGFDLRILSGQVPIDLESMLGLRDYKLAPLGTPFDDLGRTVVDLTDHDGGELSVRRNDIFVATAWWTASQVTGLRSAQRRYHGEAPKFVYLIQDHEPGFYPWSDLFAGAHETYSHLDETIALFNSEELANYFVRRYHVPDASVIRYQPNAKIRSALTSRARERIILFYGRPAASRNCFETICRALRLWQQADPVRARSWRIVSAGSAYPPSLVGAVANVEVRGKLDLDQYADLLGRASIGISLMLSPHPSYPPLEMAHAGLRTITNSFECKDLGLRNPNFVSIDAVTSDVLAGAIGQAVIDVEPGIGQVPSFAEIAPILCEVPDYDPEALALRLKQIVGA